MPRNSDCYQNSILQENLGEYKKQSESEGRKKGGCGLLDSVGGPSTSHRLEGIGTVAPTVFGGSHIEYR